MTQEELDELKEKCKSWKSCGPTPWTARDQERGDGAGVVRCANYNIVFIDGYAEDFHPGIIENIIEELGRTQRDATYYRKKCQILEDRIKELTK